MNISLNKIYLTAGLIVVLIITTVLSFVFQARPSEPQSITVTEVSDAEVTNDEVLKVDLIEIVVDESLQVELEAAKAKISALESELSTLALGNITMATEKSRLLAQLAELRANQQPDILAHYSRLEERFNRQTTELNNLKATYGTLLLEYEELVRALDLCEEED